MLAELVNKLVGLGREAAQLEVLEVPGSRGTKHYVRHGETLTLHGRAPKPLCTRFLALDDFCAKLTNLPSPEVHISRGEVYALVDSEDRHDRITLDMQLTARATSVHRLTMAWSLPPKDLVREMRRQLYGCGPQVDSAIQALSRVDFKRTSSGKSHVEHGRESLGRSVEATVQQADEIPTSFEIQVPQLWQTIGLRHIQMAVDCQVYIDVEHERVELRVPPDEWDHAMLASCVAVHDAIMKAIEPVDDVVVYLGVEQ